MKVPWYRRKPLVLNRMKAEVKSAYPDLLFETAATGDLLVAGEFPISYDGQELERYLIEIVLPRDDEWGIPIVREIGGRIPRVEDYHINTLTGEICLFVPDERWRVFPQGSSLLSFLDGPVRTYFLGVSLKLRGEPWPFGERSHGADGIFEYYFELLDTTDRETVMRYVEFLAVEKVYGHWPCPCGGTENIRNCHARQLKSLRKKISAKDAKRSLEILQSS